MNKKLILECQERILSNVHRTPVLSSRLINEMVTANVLFKCENFQKMGAFKMRGAVNAIMQLSDDQKAKGVVTHSSGNFAQALSLAAKNLGVKAYIIMPKNAPQVKVDAVKGYNGLITLCESTIEAREHKTSEIVGKTGAAFIHPSNNMDVILGNSTATLELLQDYPNLDFVVAPVGGGGLIAGTCLSGHFFGENCKIIAAEPKAVDDAYRSLKLGTIETTNSGFTIADGLRTHLGDINFPIIQKHLERIITVEENEIVEAMKLIFERLKIVIEPSSAVAFAAVLKEKKHFEHQNIGIILSGGNVDLQNLPFNL